MAYIVNPERASFIPQRPKKVVQRHSETCNCNQKCNVFTIPQPVYDFIYNFYDIFHFCTSPPDFFILPQERGVHKEVNPMDNKKPSEPLEPERWAKLI